MPKLTTKDIQNIYEMALEAVNEANTTASNTLAVSVYPLKDENEFIVLAPNNDYFLSMYFYGDTLLYSTVSPDITESVCEIVLYINRYDEFNQIFDKRQDAIVSQANLDDIDIKAFTDFVYANVADALPNIFQQTQNHTDSNDDIDW